MPTPTWFSQARQSLANFVQTIDDWAPSILYGAVAGSAILPLLATTGDPKEALAGIVGGLGANLIATQLEAWKDRSNGDRSLDETAFAKQLSESARNDAALRKGLDELLSKVGALEVLIANTPQADRDDLVAQLDRQFAKIQSTLDVRKIYVGGDWITVGDISNSKYVAIGAGAHAGDLHIHYEQDPEIATRRSARRQAYLNHIFDEASKLSLGGINRKAAESESEVAIPLDAIYTALWTEQSDGTEEMLLGKRQSAEGSEERQRPKRSAVAQLDRHARLVLLGTAGSGKSTFVNYVTQCLAGQALGMSSANLETLTQALPDDVEKMADKPDLQPPRQPWSHNSLLPVRVILRHFAATHLPGADTKATADPLWQHICDDLTAAALADFADDLKAELHTTGGLLLLDGLDEVPDADQQREQLKAVINDFAASFGKCRILITSRPYAYKQESWRLDGFVDTTLASFSDPQIRHFIDRWYEHIAPLRNYKSDDAQGRAERLKHAIFASDRLHVLAEQPLLLTLMASLHAWHGSDLPDKRERLYAEAVDLLLERWEKQRVERRRDGTQLVQPSLQEYLQVGRETILSVLDRIAYEVHAGQTTLEGCADIARDRLIMALINVSNNPQVKHLELVNYLSQRAGLLLPEGNTLFRFPHRTFQEYLAARYLTSNQVEYPDKMAELLRADPSRWREVALLAIAKAAEGYGSSVWNMVDACCPYLPSAAKFSQQDGWGAQIAGQGLLETARLENLPERNQEKVERVRQGLIYVLRSDKFAPNERALAGRTLARLGDPRPEIMTLAAMQFCYVPPGTFLMGSPDDEPDAYADEKPQQEYELAYPYWISRFPISNAQFEAFVQAGGYQNPAYWQEAQQHELWQAGKVQSVWYSWDEEKQEYERHLSGWRTGPANFGEQYRVDNHPVIGVNWYESLAFCRWLTEDARAQGWLRQDWHFTLPNEPEWEKAARGSLQVPRLKPRPLNHKLEPLVSCKLVENKRPNRRYPWGDQTEPTRMNCATTKLATTTALGCFANGASPYQVEELSGSVWEWTRSLWGSDFNTPEFVYPYSAPEEREQIDAAPSVFRIVRGGSWYNDENLTRCSLRSRAPPRWQELQCRCASCVRPHPLCRSVPLNSGL